MDDPRLPDFDLVVATVDRVAELEQLLQSLERQSHQGFRVLVVDQNDDDRLGPLVERPWTYEVTRLRSAERGLSRARNAALGLLSADRTPKIPLAEIARSTGGQRTHIACGV